MKDVIIRNQPGTPGRQIVLRPVGKGAGAFSGDGKAPLSAVDVVPSSSTPPRPAPDLNLEQLRDEVASCHQSLQEWTRAEVEWSQQRRLFEIMTSRASDLIVLLDAQGQRTWTNPAYTHAMGFSAEELIGKHALAEIHPDDRTASTQALDQTLSDGSTQQSEFRVQKQDGEWVSLKAEFIGVPGPDGRIESALIMASDMTEKKNLSEELALASTAASAAGVIEGMAHDFDQILTSVFGNLTIAKNLNGPHNAIAVRLNEMERALQRARDLIEQMFSITPENNEARVRVALEPTVQEAVSTVLRGTLVRAEYLFPRNLHEVDVDREAFSHAIRNVITNSLEAMDKGVVRCSAENIPHAHFSYRLDLPLKAGDYVCLHIQDQGHGISEKAQSRVFEPYFTTRSGSQGLGLTTALSSIQRMGGTILIDSTPGVGTTASIYLPAATGAAPTPIGTSPTATKPLMMAAAPGSLDAPSPVDVPIKTPQKKRILLMDDEQMILDIVSRMLGHLGYEVTTCTDGSQAIAAFAKSKSHGEPFDVVMMDLVIPNGVGGQDAVHTIKKIDPAARVVASSGHLEHPVMLDHGKFGFNAVLEKPYKLERLQQVIQTVVNAPAA